MRRTLGALLLVAVLGCAPHPADGLVLDGLTAFDDACAADAWRSPLLGEGVLDLAPMPISIRPEGVAYAGALHLSNFERRPIPPIVEDPDRIVLDHVEVTILSDGATLALSGLPNPFRVPAGGDVGFSGDGLTPAEGISVATVIPEAYGQTLAAQMAAGGALVLRLQAFGTASDGASRSSTVRDVPLRLCVGCLVTCAASPSGRACLIGQDEPSAVTCS